MLKYNELRKGVNFLIEGDPYEVVEYSFSKLQRGRPIAKTKIKNLRTGAIISRNFQQSEEFEGVELKSKEIKLIYEHRGKYVFSGIDNPSERFEFPVEIIGEKRRYLKQNVQLEAIFLEEKAINIKLPIKMDFRIVDCPPSFKGNTAQPGTKTAILETGAKIEVPMFINVGDIIRINTEEDKYVERIKNNII